MRGGQGFILVFSIIDRKSFEAIAGIMEQILRVKDVDYWPCVIVGTKSDLYEERTVSEEEGKKLAQDFSCPYIECSAKLRQNVDQVYSTLMDEILKVVQRTRVVHSIPKK
jgi:GTPase SAR1 family protein